jgi:hypothetical protein
MCKNNRKYRLHQKLKKKLVKYSSSKKTVFVPAGKEVDNLDVLELQYKFNYTIQFYIE